MTEKFINQLAKDTLETGVPELVAIWKRAVEASLA